MHSPFTLPISPKHLDAPAPAPWWRFGIVWLVISGPLLVVLASLVTAWIAWSHIDPVLPAEGPRSARGIALGANAPALQGRNHVATPADE